MRTRVWLATATIALGLGSTARGDLAIPPKGAASFTIEVDANAKENRWSALILGVVNSTPFRMSVVPQQAAANEARR